MKYKIVDGATGPFNTNEMYATHVIVGRNGVLEKNHTKYTNEQLHDITDGFMNLDKINQVGKRRLLLINR